MKNVNEIIGQPEGETIEYKSILPPPQSIAKIICSFANSKGGYLVLGVNDADGEIKVNGLSEDFNTIGVLLKALALLNKELSVAYGYEVVQGKRVFLIEVPKSDEIVFCEGKVYERRGDRDYIVSPTPTVKTSNYFKIEQMLAAINAKRGNNTSSKQRIQDHFLSVLSILDDLKPALFPNGPNVPVDEQEGKILTRILYASCADTFETYLSDLLYEIFLAKPETLKNDQTVTVKEVLNCSDMQEFVSYWAKKKIRKLQRGSVKGFVEDNKEIKGLGVLDEPKILRIEEILQIRHLYTHRNGIVDEKFLQYFGGRFSLHQEHKLSVQEFLISIEFLFDCVCSIDLEAVNKYHLATFS